MVSVHKFTMLSQVFLSNVFISWQGKDWFWHINQISSWWVAEKIILITQQSRGNLLFAAVNIIRSICHQQSFFLSSKSNFAFGEENVTHSGAGSPSASHSITKGLSFWSCRTFTFTDKLIDGIFLNFNEQEYFWRVRDICGIWVCKRVRIFSHLEEQLVCRRLFHHVWRALNYKKIIMKSMKKGHPRHRS